MDNINSLVNYLSEIAVIYGLKLLVAIPTLIIGLWLIKFVGKALGRILEAKHIDPSLRPFLRTLLNILLRVLLIISVASMLGFEMTSFIALLGAAGLAIGMSLSGTLQNFSGGVMILMFKPFRVGDVIETQGYIGTVYEIQIFNTLLKTFDNRVVFLPNGNLANSSLINFTHETERRVDMLFSISYGDSAEVARETLQSLIAEDDRVLPEPEPLIALSKLNNSSVDFTVRVWCKSEDYWNIYFDMHEKVYNTFPKKGLTIPFPQMDLHLKKAVND
ncbi:MAG: mechanosensitive ion channel protein MscS [Ignavibacteriae bacterium HGW-Ignavibacteriae-1]|jgi:small conductance mechanosensitive channel|nr:MAG: mechanosensitive ion channel protein MscS [Ignavibacteriae bacterium HGW-Ignavibacteriae-1]